MRLWRALKALGAAVLRDGVYLLPNRPKLSAHLQAHAADVVRSKGTAQIFEVNARNETEEVEFRSMFDRTVEYQELMQQIRKLRGDMRSTEAGALSSQLVRLRREFETIFGSDFFAAEAADQTRRALEELTVAANQALSPDEPHAAIGKIQRLDGKDYQGRTWATRKRPWADRLASAWLIRRFVDPKAKFVWLKSPKACPKRAVGFDYDGAVFTHIGGKVTFEVLLMSFGLSSDASLEKIGALVHYLDVGGVPVPEAPGLEALLHGARDAFSDDDALLAEASRLFDYLYAHYSATTLS